MRKFARTTTLVDFRNTLNDLSATSLSQRMGRWCF
jgi:hypothetical protein